MSARKPWEETWTAHPDNGRLIVVVAEFPDDHGVALALDASHMDRARLAAAAPELVRALLAVEWRGWSTVDMACCPSCEALKHVAVARKHAPACTLDTALTKAGLATQAERDAARAQLAAP